MSSTIEYNDYEREFIDLWTTWIRLCGGTEDEWFKIDRFKAGLSPHFALEANLKNPTTFQVLLQTCQAYNRQIMVLQAGANSTVAAIGGNLIASPILNQSSILHGGQVFPNVFMTSPTTCQSNASVIQESIPSKLEGDFSEQLNRRLDEVT